MVCTFDNSPWEPVMVTLGVVLAVVIVLGLAGISGIGTHDSRDTTYRLQAGSGVPSFEDRPGVGRRRRALAAVWADFVYAQHRVAQLHRPWVGRRHDSAPLPR
jgi:hypothetical protein